MNFLPNHTLNSTDYKKNNNTSNKKQKKNADGNPNIVRQKLRKQSRDDLNDIVSR